MFVFALCMSAAARAAGALEQWRTEVAVTRTLAENAARRAHEKAQRLHANLPADATPADQARVLNLLARTEIYLALTEPAATHAQLAFDLASRHGDRVGQAEADLNVALNSVNQGKLDTLVAAATHSLTVLEGVDRPDLLGEALLRMAITYRRMGQLEEAVTMSMQAMEIARRSGDSLVLTYAHQGLGLAFAQSDRHKEARDHFSQMREQARLVPSKLLEADALLAQGVALDALGDRTGGESLIRESIDLYRATGAPFSLNVGLFGLADHFRKGEHYKQAQPLLDEVIAIYDRYPNKIGRWYALNARSSNYQSLGNLAAARADAELAYTLARDMGFPLYLSGSAQRLAAVAAAGDDHRRAYDLSVEAAEMTAKATREGIRARMVELAQRYESESKQRAIDELTRRNLQQANELQRRSLQQRWLWTVLGGSVAVLAVTGYLLLHLRRSARMLAAANAQLQRSQNDLQHQTDVLQSILDSVGEGVSVANERGELMLINPAGEKMIGSGPLRTGPDDWTHRYGLYLPDRTTPYPSAQLPLTRAIRGESSDSVEIFMRNPPRSEGRWLSVTARPLTDKGGAARGGVAVFSDITARKRAEEEVRRLNASLEQRVQERTAQLQAANQELEAFSYSVSHDLRSPLRSIDGFSKILLEDYADKLDIDGLTRLQNICACARRMGQIIDDLLMLARMSRTEVSRSAVDLSDLAGAVAEDLRKTAPQRRVEFAIAPDLIAQADARLMRIVLENLLGNAWKFTSRLPVARIEFGRTGNGSNSVYFVRDNGVGFDPKRASKIFDAFERLHSAAEFPGTGIGLATVQRIIQRHGCQAWAESAPGQGATFYFTLPH